jgi:hypothetical protein
LRNLSVKGGLSQLSLPERTINIESYLGHDIRFEYLVKSFRDFSRGQVKRIALRNEDPPYAHFILGKLISSESFDLSSKTLCVVPCRNVSNDQWYIKDFTYFDLVVFKEINSLPAVHLNAFLRLWSSFEGQIIVTFNTYDFLDYTNPQLHAVLNNYIVDFPSYFFNDAVYRTMVDHTIHYLDPYLGDQPIDKDKYLSEVVTMNHIKADILLTQDIS